MKPIRVATDARISVLPTARLTSLSTGRPLAIECAEIAVQHLPQPDAVLDRQRPVEAVGLAHLGLLLGGGVDRHDRGERIARRQMHEQKADDADADRHRRDVEDAPEGVEEHR